PDRGRQAQPPGRDDEEGAARRAVGDGRADSLFAPGAVSDRGGDLPAAGAGERNGAGRVAEAEALDGDGLAGVEDRLDRAVDEVDAGEEGAGSAVPPQDHPAAAARATLMAAVLATHEADGLGAPGGQPGRLGGTW